MGTKQRWTEQEVDLLESLLNFCSGVELVRHYQRQAKLMGLPSRSPKSIRGKVWADYGTIKPLYDSHSARSLARLLNLSQSNVFNWIRLGHLNVKRKGKHYCITNKDFERFAMARPDLAQRGDLEGLIFILGKEKAIAVKNTKPHRNTGRPVMYVPQRRSFPSIGEAARQTYWSERTIRDHLKKQTDWRYLEDIQDVAS